MFGYLLLDKPVAVVDELKHGADCGDERNHVHESDEYGLFLLWCEHKHDYFTIQNACVCACVLVIFTTFSQLPFS